MCRSSVQRRHTACAYYTALFPLAVVPLPSRPCQAITMRCSGRSTHDHEDDTPRLAFADWFDENDQPERAAFIRAQVEFARLMSDGSDSQAVYEFLVPRDYVTWPAARWELINAGIARRHTLSTGSKN